MSITTDALNPAASIIEKFGGAERVMQITSASRTRVYRWTQSKSRGGTDGLIPIGHAQVLLEYASLNGLSVTAEDFIPPRSQALETSEAEVEA